MKKINLPLAVLAIFITGSYAVVVNAGHAWGKYHWDISTADSGLVPLELGDNSLSSNWRDSLLNAQTEWTESVLHNVVMGGGSDADCGPTAGRVEVCNAAYGDNGWLGIASIWATRGRSNHITQAVVKVNDTYFDTVKYDTDAWRDFVMCQEIGHTFGLDHQDVTSDNTNLGSCMDYTDDPNGLLKNQPNNLYPNDHDYDMMAEIYAHLNSTDGGGGNGKGGGKKPKKAGDAGAIDLNNPSAWGQAIRQDASGRNILFERNLANGQVLVTHVLWAN